MAYHLQIANYPQFIVNRYEEVLVGQMLGHTVTLKNILVKLGYR